MLELLKGGAMTAGALADAFPVSKPAMSGRFARLKAAGLIQGENRGGPILYSLDLSVVEEVVMGFMGGLRVHDIRTTIVGAGGVTHLRRIADLASLYQIRTGCHGATDLSPVTMGTALHFDTWVPNFGIQEYMRHTPETDAVFPHDYSFKDGFLYCGEAPGHGADIDEDLAARYPYVSRQLPVARLSDGTMWNW